MNFWLLPSKDQLLGPFCNLSPEATPATVLWPPVPASPSHVHFQPAVGSLEKVSTCFAPTSHSQVPDGSFGLMSCRCFGDLRAFLRGLWRFARRSSSSPPSPVQALLGGPSRRLLNVQPPPVRRFLGCTTLDTSLILFTPPSYLTKRAPSCAPGGPANPDVSSPSPGAPFTATFRNAPASLAGAPSPHRAPGSGSRISRCYWAAPRATRPARRQRACVNVSTDTVGLNLSHVCAFFSESFLETVTNPQVALSLGRDREELR